MNYDSELLRTNDQNLDWQINQLYIRNSSFITDTTSQTFNYCPSTLYKVAHHLHLTSGILLFFLFFIFTYGYSSYIIQIKNEQHIWFDMDKLYQYQYLRSIQIVYVRVVIRISMITQMGRKHAKMPVSTKLFLLEQSQTFCRVRTYN